MFVALFACAIAETFTPDPLPSQFHVTMATKADGKTEITEVYGMHDEKVFYHFEETFDEDNKKLRDLVIRGDLPVDQLFLAVSVEYNDDGSVKECKDGESNAKPRPQLPSFEYDGEPEEDVDCGNGNFDCRKISAGDDYALINKANRYVFVKQSSSEVTYTYYNEGLTDMSLFAVEKCDGSAIAGPEPIGPNPYNTFTPAPLPTYYHVSYPWTDPKDRLNKVHEYGMQNEDVFYFYEVGYDWNDESVKYYDAVVRGDMPVGTSGLFYRVDRDIDDDGTVKCTDDDENAEGRFNNDPFDYVGEPVTVKCDDESDDETLECTKYTDINGEFVIANKADRYVHTPDGYDLTYYNDGPTDMNIFAVEKCDGTQLTAPKALGTYPYNTFTPAPLPTYYHVSYPWTDPKDRLNKVHEYGMQNEDVFYFYEVGYDWNDESVKYYDAVVRGDMPVGTSGLFYRVDRDIDDDGTVKCTDDDENAEGRFNNDPFDYVGEPVTVKCDDETLECTKYTDINGEFVIANKDNHYVHTPDGYDLTFYDDGPGSMNMFAVEKCDGTQLTAPEFICGSDSSSSGTSSSGTSSSGTSSSGTGSSGTSSSGTSSSGKTSGSTKSSESSKVNSASCSTVSLVMAIVAVALLLI